MVLELLPLLEESIVLNEVGNHNLPFAGGGIAQISEPKKGADELQLKWMPAQLVAGKEGFHSDSNRPVIDWREGQNCRVGTGRFQPFGLVPMTQWSFLVETNLRGLGHTSLDCWLWG
jgi:hypothetical protein